MRDFFNNKILGFSQPRDTEEKLLYSVLLQNAFFIFAAKGEYSLAIQNLQAAEILTPDDVEVINDLGGLYAEMGLFDKAEISLKKSLIFHPLIS